MNLPRIITRFLHRYLRPLVVTPLEKEILTDSLNSVKSQVARNIELATHDLELARLRRQIDRHRAHSAECGAFLAAIEEPYRYRPTEPITADEAESWGQFIMGPLGRKMDETMINFCAQRAAAALSVPPAELERAAGFARGLRAGWETAKTLSRHATATRGNPEDDTHTAAAGLEQHQP